MSTMMTLGFTVNSTSLQKETMDGSESVASAATRTPEKREKTRGALMKVSQLFGTPSRNKKKKQEAPSTSSLLAPPDDCASLSSTAAAVAPAEGPMPSLTPSRRPKWWTPRRRERNALAKNLPPSPTQEQQEVRSKRTATDDTSSVVAATSSPSADAARTSSPTSAPSSNVEPSQDASSSLPAFLEAQRLRAPSPPLPQPLPLEHYDADDPQHKYGPHPPTATAAAGVSTDAAKGNDSKPSSAYGDGVKGLRLSALLSSKLSAPLSVIADPRRWSKKSRWAELVLVLVMVATTTSFVLASTVGWEPLHRKIAGTDLLGLTSRTWSVVIGLTQTSWWWQGAAVPPTFLYEWERAYEAHRVTVTAPRGEAAQSSDEKEQELSALLRGWLIEVDRTVLENRILSVPPFVLPSLLPRLQGQLDLDDSSSDPWRRNALVPTSTQTPTSDIATSDNERSFFRVKRSHGRMAWQDEWDEMEKHEEDGSRTTSNRHTGSNRRIDYTDPTLYRYPNVDEVDDGLPPPYLYPPLRPLHDLLTAWDPDHDANKHRSDDGTPIIYEGLLHFDYNDPRHVRLAIQFRNDERPFKLVNVPELLAAQHKWTDEYLSTQFEEAGRTRTDPAARVTEEDGSSVPSVAFAAHESPHHHFLYYTTDRWNVTKHGVPPSRINDWNYSTFAQHAKYAEATDLSPLRPHFYFQVGVHRLERHQVDPQHQSFISKDLPSLSSPNATLFNFQPDQQRGIQCRFGERGVSAATHYDGGRNSVAMIRGAKRYLLFPPSECNLLGIVTDRASPLYRHTVLNWSNYKYLKDEALRSQMSNAEREWLERAGRALAVETVVKAGEVLYVPSHWFHSVLSLQRSAQCNVRAGIEPRGNPWFGNRKTVKECKPFPRKTY